MNWEAVGIILGAVGGIEIFKFIYNLITRRKTDVRLSLAEAKTAEFKHLQETNDWLQIQLQRKEERFEEQTQLVRKQNVEILSLTSEMAEKDINHAKEIAALEIKLVEVRCDDSPCPFRQPPNAYTQPRPGLTKEQYHSQKLLPQNNENIKDREPRPGCQDVADCTQ